MEDLGFRDGAPVGRGTAARKTSRAGGSCISHCARNGAGQAHKFAILILRFTTSRRRK